MLIRKWKIDQKCLEYFDVWCWRRMENISWKDRVRKKEVLKRGQGGQECPSYNKKKKG